MVVIQSAKVIDRTYLTRMLIAPNGVTKVAGA
jgi:hypothetical protein